MVNMILTGILALTDHVIPGDVYAWTAVMVLPINSAMNPFLYTLSAILGRKVSVNKHLSLSALFLEIPQSYIGVAPIAQYTYMRYKRSNTQGSSPNVVKVFFIP